MRTRGWLFARQALTVAILFALVNAVSAFPQSMPLTVDASATIQAASPADYQGGSSRAPDGTVIGVTDRYLTLGGKPWLPVMGELHYSRVPEAEWEGEILKMKSAGVNVISTYILWIHHEEIKGAWDWTGQRDLRRFAELCKKHNMMLYPRIGPWAHAEARNGGFPDWILQQGPVRELDPDFMSASKTLYQQIGQQLKGMLWKDGGPVVGVQIENEYALQGPGKGADYIIALKRMAVQNGLDVPLYTVTGWDNAVVPPHEFLSVYGGYPDAPWGSSRTELPPQEVYAFRFGSRVTGNMGMIGPSGGTRQSAQATGKDAHTPFLTAELGGGVEGTYHRRPVIGPNDIAAMMPVMLGSGVNGYGIYMFHGGQNPSGKLSTLQESQATHYPTDVPQKSYDFQAPIGEYGLERPSLRLLKQWDYFLNEFGSLLAPMPAFAPKVLAADPLDLKTLRWSVRTDGHQGFLFVNNYVRQAVMSGHPETQFAVALPGGQVRQIPETPINIPSGAYFAWPFGLDLGPVPLRYGTAQLMTQLHDQAGATFVFTCIQNVRCELVLEGDHLAVRAPGGVRVGHRNGATILNQVDMPSSMEPIVVRTRTGKSVRILLLSPAQALETWSISGKTTRGLLQTTADVRADGDAVALTQLGEPHFRFAVYPASTGSPKGKVPIKLKGSQTYEAYVAPETVTLDVKPLRSADKVPPVRLGPALAWRQVGVAQAPGEDVWETRAARWFLHPSSTRLTATTPDVFLRIAYVGDEARLTAGAKLLDDNFYNGEPWLVGLRRFAEDGVALPLELQLLPIRADAPVYLQEDARARVSTVGQTVSLDSVTLLPQFQLNFKFPTPTAHQTTSAQGTP